METLFLDTAPSFFGCAPSTSILLQTVGQRYSDFPHKTPTFGRRPNSEWAGLGEGSRNSSHSINRCYPPKVPSNQLLVSRNVRKLGVKLIGFKPAQPPLTVRPWAPLTSLRRFSPPLLSLARKQAADFPALHTDPAR